MVNRTLRLVPATGPLRRGPTLPRGPGADGPQHEHFERLGLSVAAIGIDRVELTGCFAGRVDIRAITRPAGDDEAPGQMVWDVLGHWRSPRRLCLRPGDLDEWLGLPAIDAFALLRGLRNDALAEAQGPSAATDGFDWHGHRILNPFRDRFGNDTSPASEYGADYRLWRARWRDTL